MFSQAEIKSLLEQYELVRLYTDAPSEEEKINQWFQQKAFTTIELPLYVILEPRPDGKTIKLVDKYEVGKINDVAAFADFLKKPLAADGGKATAQAAGN